MLRRETVTSPHNAKFRQLLQLRESAKLRRELGLCVVEGQRELERCLAGGGVVRTVFTCPEILGETMPLALPEGCHVVELPLELYRKASLRDSTEGMVAEVAMATPTLERLDLPPNPLVLVLEAVEKPGNLGAAFRTADAAGAHAVILCDCPTDLFNPNLIRASLGTVFCVPTAVSRTEEAIAYLKRRGIRILTAQLQDASPYDETPMTEGTALVMGAESTGLSTAWREAADAHLRIPMAGKADSLNVSVSAAILLYEAVRQRKAISPTKGR